ncbi:hypothetical protein BJ912DRAFT_1054479 [Pholiota molesta]|nr:hypothetical protein BJ912DRAFT_1054479 [Pholiota molesta]
MLGDNEIRASAEKVVTERLAHTPELCLLALAQLSITADTEVREMLICASLVLAPVAIPSSTIVPSTFDASIAQNGITSGKRRVLDDISGRSVRKGRKADKKRATTRNLRTHRLVCTTAYGYRSRRVNLHHVGATVTRLNIHRGLQDLTGGASGSMTQKANGSASSSEIRCSSFSDEQAHAQDAMEILDNEAEVDVANAMARIQLSGKSIRLGDVEDVIVSLHTEIFSL